MLTIIGDEVEGKNFKWRFATVWYIIPALEEEFGDEEACAIEAWGKHLE